MFVNVEYYVIILCDDNNDCFVCINFALELG